MNSDHHSPFKIVYAGASWLHAPNCPALHVDQQHRQHSHDGVPQMDDKNPTIRFDQHFHQIPILEAVVVELGTEHRPLRSFFKSFSSRNLFSMQILKLILKWHCKY